MADATTVTGDIHYYEQTSDDDSTTSSGFCKNCGNPVIKKNFWLSTISFLSCRDT